MDPDQRQKDRHAPVGRILVEDVDLVCCLTTGQPANVGRLAGLGIPHEVRVQHAAHIADLPVMAAKCALPGVAIQRAFSQPVAMIVVRRRESHGGQYRQKQNPFHSFSFWSVIVSAAVTSPRRRRPGARRFDPYLGRFWRKCPINAPQNTTENMIVANATKKDMRHHPRHRKNRVASRSRILAISVWMAVRVSSVPIRANSARASPRKLLISTMFQAMTNRSGSVPRKIGTAAPHGIMPAPSAWLPETPVARRAPCGPPRRPWPPCCAPYQSA